MGKFKILIFCLMFSLISQAQNYDTLFDRCVQKAQRSPWNLSYALSEAVCERSDIVAWDQPLLLRCLQNEDRYDDSKSPMQKVQHCKIEQAKVFLMAQNSSRACIDHYRMLAINGQSLGENFKFEARGCTPGNYVCLCHRWAGTPY